MKKYDEGGKVSAATDTGSAKARADTIYDDRMREKLKYHYGFTTPEYKAKNPEPDWQTKNRFDDDRIEISPLIRIYKGGGKVKNYCKGGKVISSRKY
jgi:hypothetical protein